MRWYQEGADLSAKLTFLAAYLGHKKLAGTQHYLHLTTAMMPVITARVGKSFGHLIPGRAES
jgi:integrase